MSTNKLIIEIQDPKKLQAIPENKHIACSYDAQIINNLMGCEAINQDNIEILFKDKLPVKDIEYIENMMQYIFDPAGDEVTTPFCRALKYITEFSKPA